MVDTVYIEENGEGADEAREIFAGQSKADLAGLRSQLFLDKCVEVPEGTVAEKAIHLGGNSWQAHAEKPKRGNHDKIDKDVINMPSLNGLIDFLADELGTTRGAIISAMKNKVPD